MSEPATTPPPWRLRGRGYVFVYAWSRALVEGLPLPEALRGRYRGGPGALMLVDYEESPVGPYRELLLVAGRFDTPSGRGFSIPNILVSSPASVASGRAHWGLPKELADFRWEPDGPRAERVCVSRDGAVFFSARLQRGLVPFPVVASPWPLPFTLAQPFDGRTFLTVLRGAGLARRARILSARVEPSRFPDMFASPPLLGLHIAPFHLIFPVPRVVPVPRAALRA